MDSNVAIPIMGKLQYHHNVYLRTILTPYNTITSVQCSTLYISPPAAGTVIIYDPPGYDKEFYDTCCLGNGWGCNLFYLRRLRDTCEHYSPLFCCGESVPS